MKEQYDSKDRYDVMDEMKKEERNQKIKDFVNASIPIVLNFVFICVATFIIIYLTNKRFDKLEKMIENNKKEVKTVIEDKNVETLKKDKVEKNKKNK